MTFTNVGGRIFCDLGRKAYSPHVKSAACWSNNWVTKVQVLHQYRFHLHAQYRDRTCLWQLQSQSSEPNCDVLFISTDGLDQAKFALPRHPDLRANAAVYFRWMVLFWCCLWWQIVVWCQSWYILMYYSMVCDINCDIWCLDPLFLFEPFFAIHHFALLLRAKHERPRVKVHGAWAFGHFLNIFVLDEPAKHDSSSIIEIIAQTIEDASWHMIASNIFLWPYFHWIPYGP